MKLTEFRIENYRSIQDSGWVAIDDIAAIVGKNESGKTSLLTALWKFKPFHDEPYNLKREWPRGRRKEMSEDKVVSTVRFQFTPAEVADIEAIHESAKGITGVEIKRNYAGEYLHNFIPKNPNDDHDLMWVVSLLKKQLGHPPEPCSDHFKNQYKAGFKTFIEGVKEHGGSQHAVKEAPKFKAQVNTYPHPHNQPLDNQAAQKLQAQIDATVSEIETTPMQRVVDFIHARMPTFVYMDDYRTFRGAAQLDEVLKRKQRSEPQDDDETVTILMEMSGLNLEQEVKKGNEEDREQRILDMNDASQTLTSLIADRWSQKKYEVMFQADGQHFITFVKDAKDKVLVPLEERSRGFQWFFSFDMMFMYETQGMFENAIILLDEPGLHLHAAAQRDLLNRMKAYAQSNQLVYTTHLPFMIEFTRLDNIYVAEEMPNAGTKVHKNWATADKDARFTLQAALGLSWSQSLFVGQFNLVVEGVTDFWFLTSISTLLRDAGQTGLDEQLVLTPVGGASKAAYVGTILHGQNLKVAVLLDSDPEGKTAYEQLIHQWILDEKHVLRLGDVLGVVDQRTLEDLFDEGYYVGHVSAAYAKELGGKPLVVPADRSRPVIQRIEEALKAHGVDKFNKGRAAKRIMDDLPRKKLADLPVETVENFKKVILAINAIADGWKKSS